MGVMASESREELRRILDQLPEGELRAARRYLEYLRDLGDPVRRAFETAPEDDEPESEEEARAVQEGRDAIERGEVVSDAEVRRQLGL